MGGIVDLVTDGVNGLLYEATSAADLAQKLAALVRDPRRVSELGAATPAVKSIEQDAADWDARYEVVLRSSQHGRTA
jgi:glycosyltransferase involved in cell wall biosynthesis